MNTSPLPQDMLDSIDRESHAFWQWSSAIWQHPQVEKAAISLQEIYSIDVQLLLLSQWYGLQNKILIQPLIEAILFSSLNWSLKITLPLRSMQIYLKETKHSISPETQEQFRQQIKYLELESERLQQYQIIYSLHKINLQEGTQITTTSSPVEAMQTNFMHMMQAYRIQYNPRKSDDGILNLANILLQTILDHPTSS